jgi:nicotinamidase-related amidase
MALDFVEGESVALPAIPFAERMELPANRTALIIVDMQNDFVTPGGSLVGPHAAATLPALQQLLARARTSGVRVAFTQDTHMEGDREWTIWPEHTRQGTWGWEIVDTLAPLEGELVVQKARYDGFYGTSLEHYLTRQWGVEHLVIVGTIANICVLHTAASAGLRWFHVVIPADGISALTDFDQALTLRQASWLYAGHVVRRAAEIEFV